MKTICFKAEKRERGMYFRCEEDSKEFTFETLKDVIEKKHYSVKPESLVNTDDFHPFLEQALKAISEVEQECGHGISNMTLVTSDGVRTLVEWLDPEPTDTHFWVDILIEKKGVSQC